MAAVTRRARAVSASRSAQLEGGDLVHEGLRVPGVAVRIDRDPDRVGSLRVGEIDRLAGLGDHTVLGDPGDVAAEVLREPHVAIRGRGDAQRGCVHGGREFDEVVGTGCTRREPRDEVGEDLGHPDGAIGSDRDPSPLGAQRRRADDTDRGIDLPDRIGSGKPHRSVPRHCDVVDPDSRVERERIFTLRGEDVVATDPVVEEIREPDAGRVRRDAAERVLRLQPECC